MIFRNADEDSRLAITTLIVLIGALTAVSYGLGKYNRAKAEKGELSPTEKLSQIRTNNLVTNLTLISTILTRFYLTNTKRIKPAAVLAGIPLGTVDELSVALSDRILKYRATGGVFLAHQDGGNESLRIVCKAWGTKRYLFLILLDFLFLYGTSRTLDLFKGISFFGGDAAKPILSKPDFAEEAQVSNPWRSFELTNMNEGQEEWHLTFPIVTRNRIFSSMYLETYDIVESVNTGMNMLTVTLFLRKYRPPYPLQLVGLEGEKKKKKVTDPTEWYRSEKVKNQPLVTKVSGLRWIDSILDFGLSLIVLTQRYLMMKEYTAYGWSEIIALSFATHLDKSTGLDKGINLAVFKDKDDNVNIPIAAVRAMGLFI